MASDDAFYQPSQPERTVSISYAYSSDSLERTTLAHVIAGGLPIHVAHLKQVKEKLTAGHYKSDREALIREIKRDPALFVYCIREAKKVSGDFEHPVDVFSELRTLPYDGVMKLLNVSPQSISKHTLAQSNIIQASVLQHMLLCVAAVEALAPQLNIDPEAAYTVSVFRELGDALLVWNYSEVHARVLGNHRRFGSEIEAEWNRLLGITPHEIGIALADAWKLPTDVQFAFRQHGKPGTAILEITEGVEPGLHALSELADLYAQVHDPQHYPDGCKRWLVERESIEKVFGDHLIEHIDARVTDIFALYAKEVPALDKLLFAHSLQRGAIGGSDRHKKTRHETLRANSYVTRCPDPLKKTFHNLYECIGTAAQSVAAIRLLAEKLVPRCGFERGCLYLLDSHSAMLHPALRFGDLSLDHYPPYSSEAENEFSASFRSGIAYHSAARGVAGDHVDRIIGGLKNTIHPGVLYLELSASLANDSSADPLLLFQAIRSALDDILATK